MHPIERIVQLYGDLIFDLCQSVLWNTANAQVAFRAILKEIRRSYPNPAFREYERAWVMKVACKKIETLARKFEQTLSPSERIMLDAVLAPDARLQQFPSYLQRLPADQRVLLLLRDKYGFSLSEIAATLGLPEGTLKLRRQQALDALEQWIWSAH